jgi:hypothetical protein
MGCLSSKAAGAGGGRPQCDSPSAAEAWDGTLRSVRPWKTAPSISGAQLARLRSEFWDTRVQGDAEMWAALRTAADARRAGGDGAALAPELLRAAGLSPASAKRPCLDRCYDESGVLYVVPAYALQDPENFGEEPVCGEFKDAALLVQDMEKGDASVGDAPTSAGRSQRPH